MHEQVAQTLMASAVAQFPLLHLTPRTTYIVSYGLLTRRQKVVYVLVWHVDIRGRILPVSIALGSAAHDSLYVVGEVAIERPCTNLWAVAYGFPEWSGVWRRTIRILG